jgi:hypothetical protein
LAGEEIISGEEPAARIEERDHTHQKEGGYYDSLWKWSPYTGSSSIILTVALLIW